MKLLTRRSFLKAALGFLGAAKAKALSPLAGDVRRQGPTPADDTRKTMSPATEDFFETRKHLIDYYRAHPRTMPLKAATPEELKAWTASARAKFIELTGAARMTPAANPNPRQADRDDRGDYVRELWLIDTEPDVTMPFYLLRPKAAKGRTPAVICCHGHGTGKDAVAGVANDSSPDAFGVQFAKAGFLAACPDARGFGQRREADARRSPGQSSCNYLQMVGLPMGISVVGSHAFDLARLTDYLGSRDDVRADRIGCVGFSGGGWQTLAAGIVDQRLACLVVSGYIHPIAAPLLFGKHMCACNMVPGLWDCFEMGDLAALIAPRPLMIQTGDSDSLSGPDGPAGVKEQVDIAAQAYDRLGCADRLAFEVFRGAHQWSGAKPLPWVKQHLAG